MLLNEVLQKTIQFFKDKKIESARLDAEILFSHGLKLKRIDLYVQHDRPLNESELSVCRELVKRRAQGEPIAYITQEKEFFGYKFFVDSGVLIPRPETEHLVEEALDWIKKRFPKTHSSAEDHKTNEPQVDEVKQQDNAQNEKIKIADLGAGSGCVGIALLKKLKSLNYDVEVDLFEKSESAIRVIQKNIDLHEVRNSCEVYQVDLNLSLTEATKNYQSIQSKKYDIIVANPPYIDKDDPQVQKEVKQFEPHSALFSDDQGLECIKKWSTQFSNLMNDKSLFLMEIGSAQGPIALGHFSSLPVYAKNEATNRVEIKKDLAGLDRYVYALKS